MQVVAVQSIGGALRRIVPSSQSSNFWPSNAPYWTVQLK